MTKFVNGTNKPDIYVPRHRLPGVRFASVGKTIIKNEKRVVRQFVQYYPTQKYRTFRLIFSNYFGVLLSDFEPPTRNTIDASLGTRIAQN